MPQAETQNRQTQTTRENEPEAPIRRNRGGGPSYIGGFRRSVELASELSGAPHYESSGGQMLPARGESRPGLQGLQNRHGKAWDPKERHLRVVRGRFDAWLRRLRREGYRESDGRRQGEYNRVYAHVHEVWARFRLHLCDAQRLIGSQRKSMKGPLSSSLGCAASTGSES